MSEATRKQAGKKDGARSFRQNSLFAVLCASDHDDGRSSRTSQVFVVSPPALLCVLARTERERVVIITSEQSLAAVRARPSSQCFAADFSSPPRRGEGEANEEAAARRPHFFFSFFYRLRVSVRCYLQLTLTRSHGPRLHYCLL